MRIVLARHSAPAAADRRAPPARPDRRAGCLGIWTDAHRDALKPIVQFVKQHGSVPAIQLAHAGRKASGQRPWHGNGPLAARSAASAQERPEEQAWGTVAPSAVSYDPSKGWPAPHALSTTEIRGVVSAWGRAARRAHEAGFEVLEIHGAHGYLISEFLSPLANKRTDAYGGSRQNRMRFLSEVVGAVRAEWPEGKPLFLRISAVDHHEDGWQLRDSVALAARRVALPAPKGLPPHTPLRKPIPLTCARHLAAFSIATCAPHASDLCPALTHTQR